MIKAKTWKSDSLSPYHQCISWRQLSTFPLHSFPLSLPVLPSGNRGNEMSEEWVRWGSFTGQFFPSLPLAISFFILDVNWRDKGREWRHASQPNVIHFTIPSLFSRSLHHLSSPNEQDREKEWQRPRIEACLQSNSLFYCSFLISPPHQSSACEWDWDRGEGER